MKTEIITCDLCEAVVSQKRPFYVLTQKTVHGACWKFGYSINGWGSRRDHPSFSGEVCEECFNYYQDQVIKFNTAMNTRKGINKQQVIFKPLIK